MALERVIFELKKVNRVVSDVTTKQKPVNDVNDFPVAE